MQMPVQGNIDNGVSTSILIPNIYISSLLLPPPLPVPSLSCSSCTFFFIKPTKTNKLTDSAVLFAVVQAFKLNFKYY